MSDRTIRCTSHGDRIATFVCGHIVASHQRGNVVGFHYSAQSGDPFPNAWCDDCDDYLMAHGGVWDDVTEAFARVSVLCSACYFESKTKADEAGKLTVH